MSSKALQEVRVTNDYTCRVWAWSGSAYDMLHEISSVDATKGQNFEVILLIHYGPKVEPAENYGTRISQIKYNKFS